MSLLMEKLALNAQKSRSMANKVGLIPEGNWKFALRRLRNMKSGKLLNGEELRRAKGKLGSLNNNAYQKLKAQQRKQLPGTEVAGEIMENGNLTNIIAGKGREFSVKFKDKKTNMHTHPLDVGEGRFMRLKEYKDFVTNDKPKDHWELRNSEHLVNKSFVSKRGDIPQDFKGRRTTMIVEPSGMDYRFDYHGRDLNNLNSKIKNLNKDSMNNSNYSLRIPSGRINSRGTAANYLTAKHTGPLDQDMKNIDGYGKHTIVNTKQDLEGIHRLRGNKMSSIYFDRSGRNK